MATSAPFTRDDLPVAVSFTRRADPAQTREMTAWIRAGLSMAESSPGFLGGGWVRSRRDVDEWHTLARFADQPTSAACNASSEREWWLRSAQGLADCCAHRSAGCHSPGYRTAWPGRSTPSSRACRRTETG